MGSASGPGEGKCACNKFWDVSESKFFAVLGHVKGRWQSPPRQVLQSQFSVVQTGDPPGATTASETHGRCVPGFLRKAWPGHTPGLGCSAGLLLWAQLMDRCPEEENCRWADIACPPDSCCPRSGGVRIGPNQLQDPPAWLAGMW